jgi:predicted dehydrogenase
MRLRVGIIGLGESWERRYRPALRALRDRFEVRGVYSPVGLLADKAARQLRVAPSHGYQELVRRSDVDAVLVLSCDWLGPLPILAACQAGKAIYSAAHLELDLDQAAGFRDQVDRSGVAFMAEFVRRHSPATVRLKELIATRLGAPQLLFCHHRGRSSKRLRPSRARPPAATDRLMELVDWCCYIVGQPPGWVWGVTHCMVGGDREDYRALSLDFSGREAGSGPLAQISFGNYLKPQWPEAIAFRPPAHLQVSCERGVAFVDLPSTLVWFDEAGRHQELLDDERPVGEQLLMHFHRAVTSLVRKRSDLDDAFRALRIVSAARRSGECGQRIPVP